MKRIINLVLAIMMISSVSVFAQAPKRAKVEKTPEQRIEAKIANIEKTVGTLTDAEKKEMRTLFLKQDKQRAEHRAERKGDREAARLRMQENNATCDAELKKILGEERYTKFDEVRQERRAMRSEVRKERRAERKDNKMLRREKKAVNAEVK